jgi:hypothetical protein
MQCSCYIKHVALCLLHYDTQLLTTPPTHPPFFRDHPYRTFKGGIAVVLLEVLLYFIRKYCLNKS